MDHIFSITRKPYKNVNCHKQNLCKRLDESVICTVSSTNVVAFCTEKYLEETSTVYWSSNVYIADLNSPWQVHRVLTNSCPITVLQWDYTGDILLVADESGCVRIYKAKDHILNDWSLILQTTLQGEHILAAAFFHTGNKICLNPEKKDSTTYIEKFQHVKFACSVKQFGGRPAKGALLLTTTGMLGSILLPQSTSQSPVVTATESLGPARIFITTADICYGKNGHFLLAVSSGKPFMPIQCFKVTVVKNEDKCVITSQSLLSFFLFEAPPETLSNDTQGGISEISLCTRDDHTLQNMYTGAEIVDELGIEGFSKRKKKN